MKTQDALIAVLVNMDMRLTDKLIPGRGEPHVDPTTKATHIRFTREGDDAEYHVSFKVERSEPFK